MGVTIQSVVRALHILNTLAAYSDGLTNREIAEKVGLNVSTTHHLVNTLAAEGYVRRLDDSKYCLGHAVAPLYNAYLSNVSLHTHLYDALNKLAEVTKETAYLCVWHNGHALIQAIVEGTQAVRVGGLYVGFMGNTHLRASGKALLAYLDEQELEAYLTTADFTPLTARSVCDPEELREQLQEVVRRGYAIDRGEFADDVNCAATPVFSAEGAVVAVLAISAPERRFVQNEDQLVRAVVQAASNASHMLGYKS
jgi:DNA-binding IclR family transcriptional regulator